ncbi:hypothetical protein BDQ17DRAFT_1390108 [Cyathus striatus]|nr:hypothetical protein BDQ17DRAFT_1390108 [Cyathus striatus]
MDELTSKPGWEKKIFDENITTKWKNELLSSGQDVSELMVKHIFDELRYKADVFAVTNAIMVYDAGVVKSDTIVPPEFKTALLEAVKPLEDVPENMKDWHPGSDNKVLDLVHPSLFPLVYGLSRILPDERMGVRDGLKMSGKGEVIPVRSTRETGLKACKPDASRNPYGLIPSAKGVFSTKFQWLPCEVDIQGENAKITSYINNLHPKEHNGLYGFIERLVDYSIPLWDMALSRSRAGVDRLYPSWEVFRNPALLDSGVEMKRILFFSPQYSPEYDDLSDSEGPQQEKDEDKGDYVDRRYEWWETTRVCVQPEPREFKPPTANNPVKLRDEYRQYGLQVVVKLANIVLTPEKPEYEGGAWHVEGQMNEHIVATALYYYSSENITTSQLAFRQQCDSDRLTSIHYPQYDFQWLSDIFGLHNEGPAVQPFKLEDPTKPGHRKIVALFLVDPNIKIISTANVPCQRKDWWRDELEANNCLMKFPTELRDNVYEHVEFPIGMEKAKEIREELMHVRRNFTVKQRKRFTQEHFNLCEH